MRKPVVFDIETQHTFREFKDPKDLKVSVAAIYDYNSQALSVYEEHNLRPFFSLLENASLLIGYNIISFDLPVLSRYYPGDIRQFSTLDLLEDTRARIGRRLGLDDFVRATLGTRKTAHGLEAIDMFNEGRIEELKEYCKNDVMITKALFEWGVEKGSIHYLAPSGKITLSVDWKKALVTPSETTSLSLTLPF